MFRNIFKSRSPRNFYSEANIFTLIRLISSISCFMLAILDKNIRYLYLGFVIHWIGDFIDGFIARKFKQETIIGAEIDLIADRLEIILFYAIFLYFRPYLFLAASLYLIDYAFIDFFLGYQFNKFGIISPNYFYKVDRRVHLLNFSPGGKFLNSSVVTLMLIFMPNLHITIAIIACGLIIIKSYSIYLLYKKGLIEKFIISEN
jgi:hypothetical protein